MPVLGPRVAHKRRCTRRRSQEFPDPACTMQREAPLFSTGTAVMCPIVRSRVLGSLSLAIVCLFMPAPVPLTCESLCQGLDVVAMDGSRAVLPVCTWASLSALSNLAISSFSQWHPCICCRCLEDVIHVANGVLYYTNASSFEVDGRTPVTATSCGGGLDCCARECWRLLNSVHCEMINVIQSQLNSVRIHQQPS